MPPLDSLHLDGVELRRRSRAWKAPPMVNMKSAADRTGACRSSIRIGEPQEPFAIEF
jgi:hypothetical protein